MKMKTTLKLVMLILGAGFSCVAFASLVGLISPAAFVSSDDAVSLFAVLGLMLIGINDYSRPNTVHYATVKSCPVTGVSLNRCHQA